ncbi:PEGA domain-containing protein [candidate division GN15 bacterium]|nr:PEGA domain-containing protein [candidate division GN15 bacterium]
MAGASSIWRGAIRNRTCEETVDLLKRILTRKPAALAVLALCTLSVAWLPQAGWSQNAAGVTINSSPPGAEVILEGDATVTAVTPTTIRYPLIGEYELKVRHKGYETYKSRVVLDPSKAMQLEVELSRKTGVKAAARSVFVPGWGQWYTDQKTKSFTFSMLFAGAVAGYFILDNRFQNKEDDYNLRLTEYDNAVTSGATFDELERRREALLRAQEEAFDAEDHRRIAIGAVAGVWALNVLDALLFSPTQPSTFTVKGISVGPTADTQSFGLKFTHTF